MSVTQNPTYVATQNYLTDVGAFPGSYSYYGTFDQTGELNNWNDFDGTPSLNRVGRGGFWFAGSHAATNTIYAATTSTSASYSVGFRLAARTN